MTSVDDRVPPPADPAERPPTRRDRRRARRDRSRRTTTRVVAGSMAGLLVVGGALAGAYAADIPPFDGDPPTSRSVEVDRSSDGTGGAGANPNLVDPADAVRRALTPEDPLRLWIAGDSLAGALGPSLGRLTGNTGVVQPVFDSRVSSGIASTGVINWPRHATDEIARLDPEVVVFYIGTNDAGAAGDSRRTADGRPLWRVDYVEKTREMMRILVGDEARPVYWLGAPVVRDKSLADKIRLVNEVFVEVAREFPTVTYVSTYELTDDDADDATGTVLGPYTDFAVQLDGRSVRIRGGDGIHFTGEGGDHLAAALFPLIDKVWKLTDQAVPSRPKSVQETRGSSRVTTPSGSGSNSSSAGSTPTTTVAAATSTTVAEPAPTTTAPPPTTTATSPPTTTTAVSGTGTGTGTGSDPATGGTG